MAWDVRGRAAEELWGGRGYIWGGAWEWGRGLDAWVLGGWKNTLDEAERKGIWGTGPTLGVETGVERDEGGSRVEGWRQGTR